MSTDTHQLRDLAYTWRHEQSLLMQTLNACRESRARMNRYTPAQRNELYARGLATIERGRKEHDSK